MSDEIDQIAAGIAEYFTGRESVSGTAKIAAVLRDQRAAGRAEAEQQIKALTAERDRLKVEIEEIKRDSHQQYLYGRQDAGDV